MKDRLRTNADIRGEAQRISRLIIAILCVVASAGSMAAFAQDQPKNQPGPRLTFDTYIHDFGAMDDVEKVSCVFAFENTGTKKLEIIQIKPSCGCTTVELSKASFEPGERGELEVFFNPRGRPGDQKKSVRIQSNDGVESSQIIHINANVDPVLDMSARTALIGQHIYGVGGQASLTLWSRLDHFEILDIEFDKIDDDAISWEIVANNAEVTDEERALEEVPDAALRRCRVDFTLVPTAPIGAYHQPISLRFLMHSEARGEFEYAIKASVAASVVGDLKADPHRLAFGRVRPGDPIKASCRLRSRTDRAFSVTGIRSTSGVEGREGSEDFALQDLVPEWKVSEEDASGVRTWMITVRGVAPAEQGRRFLGTLIVETDHPDVPEFEVRYFGVAFDRSKGPGS